MASGAGTLPGRSAAGALGQAVVWAALCAGLGRVAVGLMPPGALPASAFSRIAACLLLALVSTHAIRLGLELFRGPHVWNRFYYLARLVPPAMAALWCAVLLPRTSRAAYRTAREHPGAALPLALAVLLFWAAAFVAVGDLAFEWGDGSSVDQRLKRDIVLPSAWASNVLILLGAYGLVFAATARVGTALLLVSPVYLLLSAATLAKLRFMHSAVQPLDLLRLPEFAPLFPRFFGGLATAAAAAALLVWLGVLVAVSAGAPWRVSWRRRTALALCALGTLVGLPTAFELAPSHPLVREVLHDAGAPDHQHREKARSSGPLLTFVSEIPAAIVARPPRYSPAEVASTLQRHGVAARDRAPAVWPGHVDLILYLVESLMDPAELGVRFTANPIPNLRALARSHTSGYAIVPEEFGGSANTEFESLTGMSMTFLPRGSLPFRQYIRRPLPALPRVLGELGFATVAIQADARYYYSRELVYDLLGFQRVVWVNEIPGVERAPGSGWPSDDAVVASVIEAGGGKHPFFAFAFPSSTHSPYTTGRYRRSELAVLAPPPGDSLGEVQEYVNALRLADRAIGTMIQHFSSRPDSTIIVILGDHLAPLSTDALGSFMKGLTGLPEAERSRRARRVPLVVWSNFGLPRERIELSVNALPSYLLRRMGAPLPGFLAVTDDVRARLPVLSQYPRGAEGQVWRWDSLPAPERALLDDYRLLQYDLLLGRGYALRPAGAGGASR